MMYSAAFYLVAAHLRACAMYGHMDTVEWGECQPIYHGRYRDSSHRYLCVGDTEHIEVQQSKSHLEERMSYHRLPDGTWTIRNSTLQENQIASTCEYTKDRCFIVIRHRVEQFGVCRDGRCTGIVNVPNVITC